MIMDEQAVSRLKLPACWTLAAVALFCLPIESGPVLWAQGEMPSATRAAVEPEMKPGCYLWGGSDPWQFGQKIPNRAIAKWEADNGWAGQHHLLEIDLSSYYDREGRGRFIPKGLDLQIALAKRIIDGGGEVQMMVWATPAHLATVPLSSKDPNGRASWMKYKPRDFDAWAAIFAEVMERVAAKVDMNHVWVGIGMEAHRYKFRSSADDFLRLVDATQAKLKPLNLPHVGMTQVPDLIDDQLGRMKHFVPTFDFIERYLGMGRRNGWQVDFLPIFEYSSDVARMRSCIRKARGLLDTYGFGDAEIIWNGLSPEREIRDKQKGVEACIAMGKMLRSEGIGRACWDFLEDSEPRTRKQHDNGLLEYQTLRERPRYKLAKGVSATGW